MRFYFIKRTVCFSRALLIFSLSVFLGTILFAGPSVDRNWEKHLESEWTVLREQIATDPDVIQMVIRANHENLHFTKQDIKRIDRDWQKTEGVDLFIVSLITNDLAEKLKSFQKKNQTLVEIFITDKRGLLIASTNKTSDFYQADEGWWQKVFTAKHFKKGLRGNLEFDQSSHAEAVSLYLPIWDERQKEVVGVLKAVCSHNPRLRKSLE